MVGKSEAVMFRSLERKESARQRAGGPGVRGGEEGHFRQRVQRANAGRSSVCSYNRRVAGAAGPGGESSER